MCVCVIFLERLSEKKRLGILNLVVQSTDPLELRYPHELADERWRAVHCAVWRSEKEKRKKKRPRKSLALFDCISPGCVCLFSSLRPDEKQVALLLSLLCRRVVQATDAFQMKHTELEKNVYKGGAFLFGCGGPAVTWHRVSTLRTPSNAPQKDVFS